MISIDRYLSLYIDLRGGARPATSPPRGSCGTPSVLYYIYIYIYIYINRIAIITINIIAVITINIIAIITLSVLM